MTSERNLLQSSQRQLDELLQDPNAKWNDIRNAMKARSKTACTNVALLRALSTDVGVREVSPNPDVLPVASPPLTDENPATALSENVSSTEENVTADSEAESHLAELFDEDNEGYTEYFIPTETFTVLTALDDAPTSRNKLGRLRRRSREDSCSSLTSMDPSVNLMDFGVDNFLGMEEENTKDDRRRESYVSTCTDFTCDSDGFMGWKHGNDEVSLTSDKTSLSKVLDSEELLHWEMSASARLAREEAEKVAVYLAQSVESIGFEDDQTKKPQSEDSNGQRKKSTQIKILQTEDNNEQRKKSWHIEDYEGDFHDSVPTIASGESRNLLNFLPFASSRRLHAAEAILSERNSDDHGTDNKDFVWKKYAPIGINPPLKAETVDLKDVREALMNVRQHSYNLQGGNVATGTQDAKQPSQTSELNPRAKLQHMLSGFSSEADAPKVNKQIRRRSTVIGYGDEAELQRNTSDVPLPFATSTNEDTRGAIWINRCDGDVDIQAECRKLYEPKPPPPTSRRASFFGGERPVLRRPQNAEISD